MGARIQSWFPFTCYFYLNGREWLSKSMDNENIEYVQLGNCFTHIRDFDKAQQLMDKQKSFKLAEKLNNYIGTINPLYNELSSIINQQYYWTIHQSEWATDILFKSPEYLKKIFNLFTKD